MLGRKNGNPPIRVDSIGAKRSQEVSSLKKEQYFTVTINKRKAENFFSRHILWVSSLAAFILILTAIGIGSITKAEVATFYPTTCLGGWTNPNNASGKPQVRDRSESRQFTMENSAILKNSVAQMFCGGFQGEIPTDTFQKRIVLKFSWTLKGPDATSIISEAPPPEEGTPGVSEPTPETPSESIPTEEREVPTEEETPTVPEPTPETPPDLPVQSGADEAPPSTADQTVINMIFSKAYAQEITEETNGEEETIATTSGDTLSLTETVVPSDALLEVLYTLDGNNWHLLGHVSNITNDVSFEIPPDIFTNIADLGRVQVAIRTVPRYDSVPTIYLDSLWLDVEYQRTPITQGISGFKVFILTQDKLESELNSWFASQEGIVVDDLKVQDYGGGGYLVVISYHNGGTGKSSARLKLIVGKNPETDAQTFLSSLDASQTVRFVSATTGSYSESDTTVTVPIIFIVYE